MSEPKPLDVAQRARIAHLLNMEGEWTRLHPVLKEAIQDAMAAESYWRLAVKKVEGDIGRVGECAFCEKQVTEDFRLAHQAGCPWVLANQE